MKIIVVFMMSGLLSFNACAAYTNGPSAEFNRAAGHLMCASLYKGLGKAYTAKHEHSIKLFLNEVGDYQHLIKKKDQLFSAAKAKHEVLMNSLNEEDKLDAFNKIQDYLAMYCSGRY